MFFTGIFEQYYLYRGIYISVVDCNNIIIWSLHCVRDSMFFNVYYDIPYSYFLALDSDF